MIVTNYGGPPASTNQSEADAFFARITASGYTAPSDSQKIAYNNLISTAKDVGWWDKCDIIYTLATYDSNVALMNLKGSTYDATKTGSPTFTSLRGYAGSNSSANYLHTNFNPTTASSPKYTLNSAHIGAWMDTVTANVNIAGNDTVRLQVNTSGVIGGRMNDGTTISQTAAGYVKDHVCFVRSTSTLIERYVETIKYFESTTTSTSLNNNEITLLGNNAIASWTDARVAFFHLGSALTKSEVASIRAAFRKFIIDISSPVAYTHNIGTEATAGFFIYGQPVFTTQNAGQTWSYVRDGQQHQFEIRNGDLWAGNNSSRSEALHMKYWPNNTEIWCSYQLMFTTAGTQSGQWHVQGQFHGSDSGGTAGYSPPMSLDITNNGANIAMERNYDIGAGQVFGSFSVAGVTFSRDVVHRVVYKWFPAPGSPGTSYVTLWLDGIQVLAQTSVNLGFVNDPNSGSYFKFGIYRGPAANTTEIYRYWNLEIATGTNALQSRIATPLPIYGAGE